MPRVTSASSAENRRTDEPRLQGRARSFQSDAGAGCGGVVLEVGDAGRGMSQGNSGSSPKSGVGIRGMQERVRLLNGMMEFLDTGPGTLVRIKLPRPPQTSSEPGRDDLVAAGKSGVNAD